MWRKTELRAAALLLQRGVWRVGGVGAREGASSGLESVGAEDPGPETVTPGNRQAPCWDGHWERPGLSETRQAAPTLVL